MSDDDEIAAREVARRFAQRAAAVALVSFAGGLFIALTAKIDGNYRDEILQLLLWLLSLACLIAWAVAFILSRRRIERGFEVSPASPHPSQIAATSDTEVRHNPPMQRTGGDDTL